VNIGYSQEKTITGIVTSDGIKLLNAKILVVGTDNYVLTDSLGKYKIKGIQGNVLEFSHVGKISKTFTIGISNMINIVLNDKKETIREVKVIPHVNIKRRKNN
jgi:hypothetical protein